jgi:uncharacterized delta-60 repeat protein
MSRWQTSPKSFPSPSYVSRLVMVWAVLVLSAQNPLVGDAIFSPKALFAATEDIPPGALFRAGAVVLQSDGKIVAIGLTSPVLDGVQYQGVGIARYNSDGSPDPSFGIGGAVSIPVHPKNSQWVDDSASALALQDDGKLVVAGSSGNGFALMRCNADGSVDSNFGQGGKVVTVLTLGAPVTVSALAIQRDGKIVVVGVAALHFAAARYHPDGRLDSTFGREGTVGTTITFGGDDARGLALQADGKIVVVGYSPNFGGGDTIALVRYNADGSLDKSFGTEGKMVTKSELWNIQAYALAVQADGKIVVAGGGWRAEGARMLLVRYNADGSLDPSFGEKGWAFTSIEPGTAQGSAVALQGDGKIVVAGTRHKPSGSSFIEIARYLPDDNKDPSFGVNGLRTMQIWERNSEVSALGFQPNGKIVVAGNAEDKGSENLALARFNSDGSPDFTFGVRGQVYSLGSRVSYTVRSNDGATALAWQTDGKIVVAGSSERSLAIARYKPDGSLDAAFGSNGKVTSHSASAEEIVLSIALQADGRILVEGGAFKDNGRDTNRFIFIARYNPDGGIDHSFGSDGRVMVDAGARSGATAFALQVDGKIMVGGEIQGSCSFLRYNPDGTLDVSFGVNGRMRCPWLPGGVTALALQSDGKIVALQSSEKGCSLSRYNPNGLSDGSFRASGPVLDLVTTGIQAGTLTVQDDGKLLVIGNSGEKPALVRYKPDGAVDTSFGVNGVVIIQAKPTEEFAGSLDFAIQADGKIVAAGFTQSYSLPPYNSIVARYNADGSLDSTFRISDGDWQISRLALQSDGKIMVVGSEYGSPDASDSSEASETEETDFMVARYNADGTPDAGFGGGQVATNFTVFAEGERCENIVPPFYGLPGGFRESWLVFSDVAQALAIQADGQLVIAGSSDNHIALARYNADGTLDARFGMGGVVTAPLSTDEKLGDSAESLALQEDGKIVVGGRFWNGSCYDLVLLRFNSEGTLDSSFGVNGKVVPGSPIPGEIPAWPSCGYEEPIALRVQKDGKILVAGKSSESGPLIRLNPDGSSDAGFGSAEKMWTRFGAGAAPASALALQADGKIVVVGRSPSSGALAGEFALLRYNTDGGLDRSFGAQGIVTTHTGNAGSAASDVAIQSDSKVVVVGASCEDRDKTREMSIVTLRYTADGSLDTGFGIGGKVVTPILSVERPTYGQFACGSHTRVILQPDGKIVVISSLEGRFALFRYTADGNVDTGFGKDGKATTQIGAAGDTASTLALQPDGKLVVAGSCSNRRHTNIALVRYDSEGRLDSSFSRGGKVTTRVGAGYTVQ